MTENEFERNASQTEGAAERMRPHRGTTVLVLGIIGVAGALTSGLFGLIFGIIAWVMGSKDLRAMRAGRMDPAGRSETQAGWICGIAATALGMLILMAFMIIGVAYFATRPGSFEGQMSLRELQQQRRNMPRPMSGGKAIGLLIFEGR